MFPPSAEYGHFTSHPLSSPRTIRSFISQNTWWVNASNGKVRIEGMDHDYLMSTMVWLIKRAPGIKLSLELYYESKGAQEELLKKLQGMSSEQFIKETPLFSAMKDRFLHEPVELEFLFKDSDDDDLIEGADGQPY